MNSDNLSMLLVMFADSKEVDEEQNCNGDNSQSCTDSHDIRWMESKNCNRTVSQNEPGWSQCGNLWPCGVLTHLRGGCCGTLCDSIGTIRDPRTGLRGSSISGTMGTLVSSLLSGT